MDIKTLLGCGKQPVIKLRHWQSIHCKGLGVTEEPYSYTALNDDVHQTYINIIHTNVSNYESLYNTVSITDYIIQAAISSI